MQINITERCGRLVGATPLKIVATNAGREMRFEDRDHSIRMAGSAIKELPDSMAEAAKELGDLGTGFME
jgi:hypothetical protein